MTETLPCGAYILGAARVAGVSKYSEQFQIM